MVENCDIRVRINPRRDCSWHKGYRHCKDVYGRFFSMGKQRK